MSGHDPIDFRIRRETDRGITEEENERAALGASRSAIRELRREGVAVERVGTDVPEATDGGCAYRRYRAPSEAVVEEHSERAGLPATGLARTNDQFSGEEAE